MLFTRIPYIAASVKKRKTLVQDFSDPPHTCKHHFKKWNHSKAFNTRQIINSPRCHLVAKATVATDDNSKPA